MRFLFIILLFPFFAQAQTRMYFPLSTAAPITNVSFGSWTNTAEAARYKLADTKGSSTITIGTQIGPWTGGNNNALDRQYVSTRMNAGITFTSGSTTISGQLMVREYATGDNTSYINIYVRVVSEDGTTTRATIRSNGLGNAANEFINNATHRNQTFSITCDASYTTVLGDRLVVEIGYTDQAGTTPEASAKWGENATDLPVNNTQTTDGAGWIEFSNTITFAGEAGPTRRVTIIQ